MKMIDHPNIVKFNAVEEDEKYFFIVMERLKGGDVSLSCLHTFSSSNKFVKRNI
jgi:serine/threonine protein kinase